MENRFILGLVVLAVGAGCRSAAEAERPLAAASPYAARVQDDDAFDGDDDWDVFLTPFVWAPWMEGRVRARGVSADFDVDAEDLIKDLDLAVGANLEGRRDRTSMWLEGYLHYDEDDRSNVGGTRVETEIDSRYVELAGAYAVDEDETLDLYGGVRRWIVDNEIDFPGGGGVDETERWWDPFVGLRKRFPLDEDWGMLVRGDVGGFEVGDSSDLTWQMLVELGYTIDDNATWIVGYRYLDVDYDHGGGSFEYDVRSHGIYTGVTFRFGRDEPRADPGPS